MKVLMLSLDKRILQEGSRSRQRMLDYGTIVDELHVVVYSRRSFPSGFRIEASSRVFIYPTNTACAVMYFIDAYAIARRIFSMRAFRDRRDLITAQDAFPTGLVGFFLRLRYRIPLQIQVHIDFFNPAFFRESLFQRAQYRFNRLLLPRADGVRAVSREIGRYCTEQLSISPDMVQVLPVFTDMRAIGSPVSERSIRARYPQFDFIAVMPVRFVPQKNIGMAIRAMRLLRSTHPRFGLILIGAGPEENRLRSSSRDIPSIVFEPWAHDSVAYCAHADALVLTSRYEGWGLTVVEAMASGLPVIATPVGCVNEIVRDGENGLVVPHDDPHALAAAFVRLFADPDLRSRLASAARTTVSRPPFLTKDGYLRAYADGFRRASPVVPFTVCYFGQYDPAYPRNRLSIAGLREHGAPVVECNDRSGFLRKYRILFRKHRALRHRYDVLLVGFGGALAVLFARCISRRPVVFDAFISLYDSNVSDRALYSPTSVRAMLYRLLDLASCRFADGLIFDTRAHAAYFMRSFGALFSASSVVPVCADPSIFFPRPDPVSPAIVHWHGTYLPLHGVRQIIDAAALLRDIPLSFRLVGAGPDLARMREHAAARGVSSVHFLGPMRPEELAASIGSSLFCLGIFGISPKAARVIPNKICEYLASRKAVITADTPAIRERFGDRDMALIPSGDPRALAAAIRRLYDDPAFRESLAAAGHAAFMANHTPRAVGSRLKEILSLYA